jgi:hypothetical protein
MEIKTNILDRGSVSANIFKGRHFFCRVRIKPFKAEMVNSNNIVLFVDSDLRITGGQIGKYDLEEGLRVILFNGEEI